MAGPTAYKQGYRERIMLPVRKRPPTIADVARIAGVSLPTVSRVLTGATPVREATKDRVRAAIDELGYRPNGAARALVQGQQPIVGVITPDTSAYGYSRMLLNIEERARRAGYLVAIAVLDPADVNGATAAIDVLLGQPIVGVIVLDYNSYDAPRLKASLGAVPIATVRHGDDDGRFDVAYVRSDDRKAAADVTQHLLDLGHHTVHHVAAPGTHGNTHIREQAWRETLLAAGAAVPDPIRTDWSISSARAAGAILAQDPDVTAIFCANDELAFAVMRSLHEAGRRVPEGVSVAAIDDEPLAEIWVPSLTSYHLDFEWAGAAAVELLLDPHGVTGSGTGGDFRLIARESTAPPRRP